MKKYEISYRAKVPTMQLATVEADSEAIALDKIKAIFGNCDDVEFIVQAQPSVLQRLRAWSRENLSIMPPALEGSV